MTTPTTNYAWGKPIVGGDPDTWGTESNAIFDSIDSTVHGLDVNQGWVTITSGSVSAAATLDISLSGGYKNYKLYLNTPDDPASALNNLWLRANTGSGFATSNYRYAQKKWVDAFGTNNASSPTYAQSNSAAQIVLSGPMDSSFGGGGQTNSRYEIDISNIYRGAAPIMVPTVLAKGTHGNSSLGSAARDWYEVLGEYTAAGAALTQVRLMFSSGTISCSYVLLGLKNS